METNITESQLLFTLFVAAWAFNFVNLATDAMLNFIRLLFRGWRKDMGTGPLAPVEPVIAMRKMLVNIEPSEAAKKLSDHEAEQVLMRMVRICDFSILGDPMRYKATNEIVFRVRRGI